jgi:hypothetical protein
MKNILIIIACVLVGSVACKKEEDPLSKYFGIWERSIGGGQVTLVLKPDMWGIMFSKPDYETSEFTFQLDGEELLLRIADTPEASFSGHITEDDTLIFELGSFGLGTYEFKRIY